MPSGAAPLKPSPLQVEAVAASVPALPQHGALAALEESARDVISRRMRPLRLEEGEHAFRVGDVCTNYIMVKSGSVKVTVTTEQGREIVLYRVRDGETCVLTSACLMSGAKYDAEAVAESVTEAIILPKPAFEELLASSARFRHFVFSSYGERLQGLIVLVQEVALRHVDRRLARMLLSLAQGGNVETTHQKLAGDLNTAREVVTRLLNDFEDKGWIALSRGRIALREPGALADFAGTV